MEGRRRGRPPRTIQVTQVTIQTEAPEVKTVDIKRTMIGHTYNMLDAVESLLGSALTPRCPVCYEKYKWLAKCVCVKNISS